MEQTSDTGPPVAGDAAGRSGPRARSYVWSLLGGALLGLAGGFLQAVSVNVGPVELPVGMVLVLLTLAVTIRAITTTTGSRKPAVVWFAAWLAMTLVLALPLPDGSQVIAGGAVQLSYLFIGVVVGSAMVTIPARLRPAGSAGNSNGNENGAPLD